VLYNKLKSRWEREKYIGKKRYWMVEDGHLEAEGMRRNIDKGVCPVCRKEEGGSHILQCEGTRVWRDRWL
jgi:hypothetical protein